MTNQPVGEAQNIPANQIFIFCGPTISPQLAGQHLQAAYLPPAQLGDVYRVCTLFKPLAIGIIDGYFNQVPAVWHKEILWAMAQGIRVYGASSMGALRAAELDRWGMTGCGEIYRAYKQGTLPFDNEVTFEDEDEVAVIHGPAELAFLSASDAMVNIRTTLSTAMKQGIIDELTRKQLTALAKQQFYAERNYTKLLSIAQKQGMAATLIQKLQAWIKAHAVDQKQLDAIELLQLIETQKSTYDATGKARHREFFYTAQWHAAIDEIDQSHHITSKALNELRLKGAAYFEVLDLALDYHQEMNPENTPDNDTTTTTDSLAHQLTQMHSQPEALKCFFTNRWRNTFARPEGTLLTPMQAEYILLTYLKSQGQLDALQSRADNKQHELKTAGQAVDSDKLNELEKLQLCDWYFTHQLNREMPDDVADFAHQMALENEAAFYDMILGEYVYLRDG